MEIKFRAWDKEQNRMVAVDEICWSVNGNIGLINGNPDWDMELMQFTGLYDKNGKEIYEGDILRNRFLSPACPRCGYIEEDDPYQVFFEDGWFIAQTNKDDSNYLINDDFEKTEVIGNVHENPKLVEL